MTRLPCIACRDWTVPNKRHPECAAAMDSEAAWGRFLSDYSPAGPDAQEAWDTLDGETARLFRAAVKEAFVAGYMRGCEYRRIGRPFECGEGPRV